MQRLIDAYADGVVKREEFEPRMRDLRQRIAGLQEEENRVQEQEKQEEQLRLMLGCLEDFARQVSAGLDQVSPAQKREIIRKLVKQIDIDNQEVTVVYRVSLPPFEGSPSGGILQHCPGRKHAGAYRTRMSNFSAS